MKTALEGARDIIAEQISENADLIGRLRNDMKDRAILYSKLVDGKAEAGAKFADYFDHSERWATVPGHRALAMLRGWNEEFLSLAIEVDRDDTAPVKPSQRMIASAYQVAGKGPADQWLLEVAGWTWRVKLSVSLSLDLMRELRERAEEEAIHVFAATSRICCSRPPLARARPWGLIPASAPASRSPSSMAPARWWGNDDRLSLPAEERHSRHPGRTRLAHPQAQGRADLDRQWHRQP